MQAQSIPFATKFRVKDTGTDYWLMKIDISGLWTRLIKGMDDGGILCMNNKGQLEKVHTYTEVELIA